MGYFKYLCLLLALTAPLCCGATSPVWRKAMSLFKGKPKIAASAAGREAMQRAAPVLSANYLQTPLERYVQKALRTGLKPSAIYTAETARRNIRYAVVRKFSYKTGFATSSGVIFKAREGSKEKLWIALSKHATHRAKGSVVVELFLLDGSKVVLTLPLAVYGQTSGLGADAALVALPEEYYSRVFALEWANEVPRPGEVLESYGYELGYPDLKKIPARIMRQNNDYQFLTTQKEGHSGMCGGPVLNAAGYLVGIHCGSGSGEGYAVNREAINDLLKAYYIGSAYRPIKYRDQEVGFIEIRESIIGILVKRNGKIYQNFLWEDYKQNFSYSKIQDLMDFRPGDSVVLQLADPVNQRRQIFFTVP